MVRSFVDHDGVMKYHFVGDIPEERLEPVEEDKNLWDHTVALSKKVADGTVEIGQSVVETTVNTGKTMWDGAVNFGKASFNVAAWAGEKMYGGGKAAVDFLFLDDMKTLVDNEATVGENAMAGFFLLPIGKFGKAGKLVKEYDGFKVNSKGEVPAKKSEFSGDVDKGFKYEGVRIINKKYAGQTYRLSRELAKKYPNGVKFTKDGFPDFSPYSKVNVKVDGLKGNTTSDFTVANKTLGLKKTPRGFT